MRVRKQERPPIEAHLNAEGDLDEIVGNVFATCADLLMARDWYVLIVNDPPVYYLFGPYESEAAANREVKSLVSTRAGEPLEYVVRQMYKVKETL